ncbi:MAG TPA: DNA repair protein RecO, partial [Candidatus Saccharimonadales bacterium]|nr:DNA repair protein RecO [Candidatus Saccharimonadales bacterium]
QIITTAIILSRTDFGEADRILTLLTPDQGKLRLMAKGVRRVKSKLAGGIELFSVSDITYIKGRGDIGTLVSTRLIKHYGRIVTDVGRTMLGYELIKQLNKATEDEPESDYFDLLQQTFEALDDIGVPTELIGLWFSAQLLKLSGHMPNLTHAAGGAKLEAGKAYEFSFDDASFQSRPDAPFGADDIKFLRILFSGTPPAVIARVGGAAALVGRTRQLVQLMAQQYVNAV